MRQQLRLVKKIKKQKEHQKTPCLNSSCEKGSERRGEEVLKTHKLMPEHHLHLVSSKSPGSDAKKHDAQRPLLKNRVQPLDAEATEPQIMQ